MRAFSREEVARLRALPDAQIAKLNDRDAWAVAIGHEPPLSDAESATKASEPQRQPAPVSASRPSHPAPVISKDLQDKIRRAIDEADASTLRDLFRSEEYIKYAAAKCMHQANEKDSAELTTRYVLMRAYMDADIGRCRTNIMSAQIAALEKRLAEVEVLARSSASIARALSERPAMTYEGVWQARSYREGMFVTDRGSVWYTRAPATAADRPGDSACFQLAVKRGSDGRDAR